MRDILPYLVGCVAVFIVATAIYRSWHYRARKSGTDTHPTPADLISSLLDQLLAQEQKDLVTFEGTRKGSFIQILRKGHQLVLNVSSPGKVQLDTALSTNGIAFPDHWSLAFHNKKKLGGHFTLPIAESERVKDFVHDLFEMLYREPIGFRLKGYME